MTYDAEFMREKIFDKLKQIYKNSKFDGTFIEYIKTIGFDVDYAINKMDDDEIRINLAFIYFIENIEEYIKIKHLFDEIQLMFIFEIFKYIWSWYNYIGNNPYSLTDKQFEEWYNLYVPQFIEELKRFGVENPINYNDTKWNTTIDALNWSKVWVDILDSKINSLNKIELYLKFIDDPLISLLN